MRGGVVRLWQRAPGVVSAEQVRPSERCGSQILEASLRAIVDGVRLSSARGIGQGRRVRRIQCVMA